MNCKCEGVEKVEVKNGEIRILCFDHQCMNGEETLNCACVGDMIEVKLRDKTLCYYHECENGEETSKCTCDGDMIEEDIDEKTHCFNNSCEETIEKCIRESGTLKLLPNSECPTCEGQTVICVNGLNDDESCSCDNGRTEIIFNSEKYCIPDTCSLNGAKLCQDDFDFKGLDSEFCPICEKHAQPNPDVKTGKNILIAVVAVVVVVLILATIILAIVFTNKSHEQVTLHNPTEGNNEAAFSVNQDDYHIVPVNEDWK